jgi:hypothetical protein
MKVLDPDTNQIRGYKWVRSGRDHLALATVFWMVGMQRFSETGIIFVPDEISQPNSYMMDPDETVCFDPEKLFKLHPHWWKNYGEEDDWRNY